MHPTTIGPFRIQRELGRGGMGVVYLARDTKLDRIVAVKSLPAHLADDPDRLARFQREAKVLASLNHPGIAAIYGLEEAGKHQYLVLEYVEGETLDAQLKKRAIPIDEALAIAKQIAEALEAAHEKGVIHRDLKPLNVIVTPDSVVKILDFGLARTDDGAPFFTRSPDGSDSPTMTIPTPMQSPTVSGMIMGTAGYMSPEQARGKALDKRSDIFSFGCILYELLSRERPFRGETVADMIASTLHTELNFDSLPATIPPRVRDLLVSCLSKDRKQRLHDIGDARLVLERAIQGREWATAHTAVAIASRRNPILRALPWTLAALFLVVSAVSLWKLRTGPQLGHVGAAGVIKLRVDDAEAPPFSVYDMGNLAISDDGQQVAYITQTGDEPSLILRRMDDSRIRRLAPANIEGKQLYGPSADITFSRDGRLLAAFGQSSVYVVPVSGGEPTLLRRGPENVATKGGDWTDDGFIYCPAPNAGLVFIPEKGGEPQTLTVPDPARDELSHRWPDVLPGGRKALITVKKTGILSFDNAEIALLDLNTKTWKTVLNGGTYARYIPTGHIVFARNGSIMAVPFDVKNGTVTGTPVAIVAGVTTSPGSGVAQFAVARDSGTLVYMPGGPIENRRELIWIDLEGKLEPVGAPIMPYRNAACSPDGSRIATNVFGASDAVLVYDLVRRTNTRITFRGNCGGALWMDGGSRIAYATDAEGPIVTIVVNADGSGAPQKISDYGFNDFGCLVTKDEKLGILYADRGDIWLQPFPNDPRQKLLGSQFDETEPHVSPDGHWLSYASNENGEYEVYVRPFPLTDARRQVSIGGGRFHCWAPDGEAIYYLRDADRSFLRAPFRGPIAEIGQPELMFNMPVDAGAFQAHPNGKKFLAIRELPPKFNAEQIYVVLNWFDELKAKVPQAR